MKQGAHVTSSSPPPIPPNPVDPDTAEQAVPGHGVPSQDPESSAQVGLDAHEAARESKSVLTGGGLVAGMVTGAGVGAVVAGPVGILAGGTLGAIAGVAAGMASSNAVSEMVKSKPTVNADGDRRNPDGIKR